MGITPKVVGLRQISCYKSSFCFVSVIVTG